VLDSANAQIPDLERQIGQEEDAINILLGNYPAGVPRGRPLEQQALPPEVPPGLPSSLLERRPDIARRSKSSSPRMLRLVLPRLSFFHKSL